MNGVLRNIFSKCSEGDSLVSFAEAGYGKDSSDLSRRDAGGLSYKRHGKVDQLIDVELGFVNELASDGVNQVAAIFLGKFHGRKLGDLGMTAIRMEAILQ